jgi:hypothetical protein
VHLSLSSLQFVSWMRGGWKDAESDFRCVLRGFYACIIDERLRHE